MIERSASKPKNNNKKLRYKKTMNEQKKLILI